MNRALDRVRQKVAAELGEVPANAAALTWVTDFPMFEWCAAAWRPVHSNQISCHLPVSFSFNSAARTQPLLGPCTPHCTRLNGGTACQHGTTGSQEWRQCRSAGSLQMRSSGSETAPLGPMQKPE